MGDTSRRVDEGIDHQPQQPHNKHQYEYVMNIALIDDLLEAKEQDEPVVEADWTTRQSKAPAATFARERAELKGSPNSRCRINATDMPMEAELENPVILRMTNTILGIGS